MDIPSLGIIGAGKVGCTLAQLLANAGYTVNAVYSRTQAHGDALAAQVKATDAASPGEVVAAADLTLLTVPDDAIQQVVESIGGDLHNKAVIHTSGAHDVTALSALAAQGAMTGSMHPAFPFASVETAMKQLPGATFALEATTPRLQGWLKQIVATLRGEAIDIPPGGKATYHAALVIASNYTVILYATAQSLLTGLGATEDIAANALNTLVGATVDNLREQGIPNALTGPLVRADVGTIGAHLRSLAEQDKTIIEMYKIMARLSFPVLAARGVSSEPIERLLKGE